MSSPSNYQRHIDGLRAVAVLSVIFYHFGHGAFSGGFVGVDVFFVISGYLITNLILLELADTGDFNFRRFYIRRMRRLFPALTVTLAVSLVLAVALLSPARLLAFAQSLSAAIFSVSNITFWLESGYFDIDSHSKPLLHTWSLGVEEQFYLLWPALLWLAARGGSTRRQLWVLAAVGIISFALNLVWVWGSFDDDYASTIFFLTPFRIFELVIGAMALFLARWYPRRRVLQEAGMLLGLAMIALAVSGYEDGMVFPHYYALLPCIGALLVIMSRQATVTGWLLSNRLAVGIGLISYSMYLVHWPLLVFYQYYKFAPLDRGEYLGLFLLTILLSVLMYFFVEKPLRRNAPSRSRAAPQKAFVATTLGAMTAVALAGLAISQSGGSTRYNAGSLSAEAVEQAHRDRFQLLRSGCNLNQLDNPRRCHRERPYQILVIGNSHESDGYNIFRQVYRQSTQVNLISFGTLNKCEVEIGENGPESPVNYRRCAQRTAWLRDAEFASGLDAVIYSASKPFIEKRDRDWQILAHLRRLNPQLSIVVLGGYFITHQQCSEIFNRFGSYQHCKDPQQIEYNPLGEHDRYDHEIRAGLDYLYLDKTALLCPDGTLASCAITAGSDPAFHDWHHLSFAFARMLGERIAQAYAAELVAAGLPPPASGDSGP